MKHIEKTIEILFFRFLKEYHAYGRYLKAYNNVNKLLSYVRKSTFNKRGICGLPSAFNWVSTPEGDEYWRIMLIIWNYILYSNGIITQMDVFVNVRRYRNSHIIDILNSTDEYNNLPKFKEYINILRD